MNYIELKEQVKTKKKSVKAYKFSYNSVNSLCGVTSNGKLIWNQTPYVCTVLLQGIIATNFNGLFKKITYNIYNLEIGQLTDCDLGNIEIHYIVFS